MRWPGHVTRIVERMVEYWVLVGRSDGNMPIGRPRHRRENIIKIDL
jgi:hypothetical protein